MSSRREDAQIVMNVPLPHFCPTLRSGAQTSTGELHSSPLLSNLRVRALTLGFISSTGAPLRLHFTSLSRHFRTQASTLPVPSPRLTLRTFLT